jgi:hypothetical protein
MMKFYRLEATGILAGPEKLSTILVTPVSESTAFAGWKSGAFQAFANHRGKDTVEFDHCGGKAEEESG